MDLQIISKHTGDFNKKDRLRLKTKNKIKIEVDEDEIKRKTKPQKMKYKNFENIPVWKKAHQITLDIYKITSKFPKEETYNLISQMRRAVLSVEANIAEAFGRFHFLDKVNFYLNARGSLEELKSHLITSLDLGFLDENSFKQTNVEMGEVREEINRIIKSFRASCKS